MPHNTPVDFSVVVPVYNEEESIPVLIGETSKVFSSLGKYEIVFVDDKSSDRSLAIMKDFKKRNPEGITIVELSERRGQTHAMKKGIEASSGNFVITMDADLQNDPADIFRMLEKMKDGFDCVCGWRKSRQDTLLKAGLSKTGNILQRLLTGLTIHDVSCTLRIYRKDIACKIPLNWEGQHRFIPLSLSLQGFRIGEIVSNHRVRKFGSTKYSHKRIFKVIADFFRILAARGQR